MTTHGRPTVLYIAGSGRSGSTLLERMVGAIPSYVNVGELIDLAVRVQPNDELCGCGAAFSRCPFWTEVGQRAFGGWDGSVVERIATDQGVLARQRQIPRSLLSSPGNRARRADYRDLYRRLYGAIADVAGADVVVDASKRPAQAIALAGGNLDLRVCHITRDVRGVAWSMSRRSGLRPHSPDRSERMHSVGLVQAGASWTLCQAEVELLRVYRVPLARLRYEDLMQSARAETERVLRRLSLPVPENGLQHLDDRSVELGSSHGISGNPGRFTAGRTALRLDDEWRTSIPSAQRLALSLFQAPDRIMQRLTSLSSRA